MISARERSGMNHDPLPQEGAFWGGNRPFPITRIRNYLSVLGASVLFGAAFTGLVLVRQPQEPNPKPAPTPTSEPKSRETQGIEETVIGIQIPSPESESRRVPLSLRDYLQTIKASSVSILNCSKTGLEGIADPVKGAAKRTQPDTFSQKVESDLVASSNKKIDHVLQIEYYGSYDWWKINHTGIGLPSETNKINYSYIGSQSGSNKNNRVYAMSLVGGKLEDCTPIYQTNPKPRSK